jgi:hypothetical protein
MSTLVEASTSLLKPIFELHSLLVVSSFFLLVEDKGEIDGPKEEDTVQV